MLRPAELLSRAERLIAEGNVQEAWRQFDNATSNYPTEIVRATPIGLAIDQASKQSDLVGRVSVATWPNGASAAVSCTFDDRLTSHVDVVRPDLDRFGFSGTFFVIREHPSLPQLSSDYLAKWQALGESNHEIGNHTSTHPEDLPSLAPTEIARQLDGCDEFIERVLGHSRAASFAYPFGRHGPPTGHLRECARSRFALSRSTHPTQVGPNAATPDEMDALQSFTIDRSCTLEQVQQQLDKAIESRGWVILTFHKVAQGEGSGGIDRNFWIACLNSLSARREQLWIDTVADVGAYIYARHSARVVCESTSEDELSLSARDRNPCVAGHSVPLSLSVRLPKSWRFARLADAHGSISDYRVQRERICIQVWADGRPYRITKTELASTDNA
jgi:peptidoglycan/xylan/chitin deacetylase (PgdA/CDA1 family)